MFKPHTARQETVATVSDGAEGSILTSAGRSLPGCHLHVAYDTTFPGTEHLQVELPEGRSIFLNVPDLARSHSPHLSITHDPLVMLRAVTPQLALPEGVNPVPVLSETALWQLSCLCLLILTSNGVRL